ncbi:MAG: PepSY domain-containing protein [Lautropia sp.]|nr:PepSY domain-containing protein [Lautropia sp.]
MKISIKRWLFLGHRWLGIITCLFFLMWFVSGMVMMYVGYPKLTDTERLQHLPSLPEDPALLSPREALAMAGAPGPWQELRLAVASGGRPVYLAVPSVPPPLPPGRRRAAPGHGTLTIDAFTGQRLEGVDTARAVASALAYATARPQGSRDLPASSQGRPEHTDAASATSDGARYLDSIDEDSFTHSRGLDAHRPLHRVQLDDAGHTLLYISSLTGEVVRDAPRAERLWNYVGAWIHWLYPFRGNQLDAYWTDIVNWLSLMGVITALTGAVAGLIRWRFRSRYRHGGRTPFRQGWMRWHHIGGLLFAVTTVCWIFSGLMSMAPWGLFDRDTPALKKEALSGGPLQTEELDTRPGQLMASVQAPIRELRWIRVLGQPLVEAWVSGQPPFLLDAKHAHPVELPIEGIEAAGRQLMPAPVADVQLLRHHDFHYYGRDDHAMLGGVDKPLPMLRIKFDDAATTWVHIDPRTGTILEQLHHGDRLNRWLFSLLHSWDWLPLLRRRPLWDLLLISFSLGGVLISLSGVIIGWRRLRLKAKARQARTMLGRQPVASPDGKAHRKAPGPDSGV